MLTSKALISVTTIFALFSFYAIFYSLYMTQLKFHDTSDLNLLTQGNSTSWFQPKVKVVFVIIDGFRFDYLLNYENIDHDPRLQANKLSKFNQAYFDSPDKFVVLRALADLPTMTVLRVPTLMTGNVPRLGSVLTAFGALPAEEDSVPRQLYLQNKKSYFSGDPILHEYFPQYLESDYKIGSFNIGDKTVDEPVQAYINKKLEENKFDFLATHLLRLDHMGHNSDLSNPDVLAALKDIDQYLVHIMENIDDNTMLIFGGDHGMVKEGGHGGDTPQETNTALVTYFKKGFMKNMYKGQNFTKIMRSVNDTDSQVHQIDIAPTLSMLMGLPTPFSNMGQILNDLYPVGDYLPHSQEACPDVSFTMQMLRDNHLNSLQVWNYFSKYHKEQDLFNQREFSKVSDLFEEVISAYKVAEAMISQSQQCEVSFHETALTAIQKSQQLSNQIHDLVSTKKPHDLVIFWQGFLILALTGFSYVLLVQYLYKTKDYEYISWATNKPQNWKAIAKTLTPIIILLTITWAYMLTNNFIIMRAVTTSVFVIALWILGSLAISLFSKPPQEEISETSPTQTTTEGNPSPTIPLKSFFIFQRPLITVAAVFIIIILFALTHLYGLDKDRFEPARALTPFICVLLVAARISGRYLKIAPYLMSAAVFLCIILRLVDIWGNFWSSGIDEIMGLVFLGDWLYNEVQFSMHKLKARKVWSYQYVICFIILIFYHHFLPSGSDLSKIYLPRVIWALIISSFLASLALRMPRKVIKRNLQVYLVLFLTLMQLHRKLIFFAFVLSIMRIMTFIFKRTDFKNYLYPLLMGFISYLSLFSIFFTDRKLPRSFGPAFVGVQDFHIGLCLFLYGSAMLSTIILGMLFISFYSQDLESQEVELGVQKEEEGSTSQIVALKGYSSIIRKRNILFYNLFYCLLMAGAAINPVVLTHHKKIYLSMERFLVDGVFYLFVTNVLYLMF